MLAALGLLICDVVTPLMPTAMLAAAMIFPLSFFASAPLWRRRGGGPGDGSPAHAGTGLGRVPVRDFAAGTRRGTDGGGHWSPTMVFRDEQMVGIR
jgi:hypothetical protein